MFCICIVALYFIEFCLPCQLRTVILCVYCFLLQCGKQLCERHGCGVRAVVFPLLQLQLVFHNTNLNALQIGHIVDGLVGRQCTERIFLPLQKLKAGFLQTICQSVAQRPVQNLINLLLVIKQPRNIQAENVIFKGCYRCIGCQHDIIVTKLTALQQLTLRTKYVVGVNITAKCAFGFLLQTHFEEFCRVDGSRRVAQRINEMITIAC